MISIGLGGARQRGADRCSGQDEITRVQSLEPSQGLQRLQRRIDHVAVDGRVLTDLAVDSQLKTQVAEALEFVGIQQHQRRAGRGERRIRLRLVELGFRELNIARGDIVGHHQARDVVGQICLGDLGADGDRATDHQPDLHLVVQRTEHARA